MADSNDAILRLMIKILFLFTLILSACAARPKEKPPANAASPEWRAVDPSRLLLIDVKYGQIAVELSPHFAPKHFERMRAAVAAHFYDHLSFYRVVDGFVAQGGSGDDDTMPDKKRAALVKPYPPLAAEFDAPFSPVFTSLKTPDLYAEDVGLIDGFPVGRNSREGREWMIHCPGVFAFARDSKADTATTEFYIVLGQAPRRLDRNLTAFGRVISGMQYLQKLQRGDPDTNSGVIAEEKKRDAILRMRFASELPEKDRPHFEVWRTDTAHFAGLLEKKRHPGTDFLVRLPPPVLDICLISVGVRQVK